MRPARSSSTPLACRSPDRMKSTIGWPSGESRLRSLYLVVWNSATRLDILPSNRSTFAPISMLRLFSGGAFDPGRS